MVKALPRADVCFEPMGRRRGPNVGDDRSVAKKISCLSHVGVAPSHDSSASHELDAAAGATPTEKKKAKNAKDGASKGARGAGSATRRSPGVRGRTRKPYERSKERGPTTAGESNAASAKAFVHTRVLNYILACVRHIAVFVGATYRARKVGAESLKALLSSGWRDDFAMPSGPLVSRLPSPDDRRVCSRGTLRGLLTYYSGWEWSSTASPN